MPKNNIRTRPRSEAGLMAMQYDSYKALAAAIIRQAVIDTRRGSHEAAGWLLSDDCQQYAELIGLDYRLIEQTARAARIGQKWQENERFAVIPQT